MTSTSRPPSANLQDALFLDHGRRAPTLATSCDTRWADMMTPFAFINLIGCRARDVLRATFTMCSEVYAERTKSTTTCSRVRPDWDTHTPHSITPRWHLRVVSSGALNPLCPQSVSSSPWSWYALLPQPLSRPTCCHPLPLLQRLSTPTPICTTAASLARPRCTPRTLWEHTFGARVSPTRRCRCSIC